MLNSLLSRSGTPAEAQLRGFLGIRRRTLVVATMLFSSVLVLGTDLTAAASTHAPTVETEIEGQSLYISPDVVHSSISAPIIEEIAEYDIVLYTPVQWPVSPSTTVTSTFGKRSAPCAGCSTQHSGVDWTPGYGAPVYAIADGTVISRPMGDWGSYVIIEHDIDGQRVLSGYAHLVAGTNLPVGTTVTRGDVIGLSGNTGRTSGAHLHFSIIVNDTFVNPQTWLKKHVTEVWGS